MGVPESQNIPCKFNHSTLQAKTHSKEGNVILTCIFHCQDLTVYAAITKPGTDENSFLSIQQFNIIILCNILGVYKFDINLAVICRTGMYQRFMNGFI